MRFLNRKLAVLLTMGAVLGGTGAGIADAASSGSTASTSATTTQVRPAADPSASQLQQGASDFATKIASALGADSSTVAGVLQANHPTDGPGNGSPTRPQDNSKLVKALASATGKSSSAVQAALAR